MAKPIPDGYPRVTPYLYIDGAKAAIDFYTSVLGAKERMTMPGPDGKVGHAELTIGDSVIMLADEFPDMGVRGPKSVGGSPVTIHVYVEDVDATFDRALSAGRHGSPAGGGQVLRGPGRRVRGSLRASLEHRHPRGGPLARGDAEAHGRDARVARGGSAWTTARTRRR